MLSATITTADVPVCSRLKYFLFHFSQRFTTFHRESKINKRVSLPATSYTYDDDSILY